MLSYTIRRLLQAVPVLFLTSLAVFAILRLVPGDPAILLAGESATPASIAAVRKDLGLEGSYPAQYARWLGGAVHGDLGLSYTSHRSVLSLIADALPLTLQLTLAGMVLALLLGVPLGTLAGLKRRGPWDYGLSVFTALTLGIPNFLLAIVAIFLFAVSLGWLPSGGYVSPLDDVGGWLRGLVLPVVALAIPAAAIFARFTRAAVAETMRQDFIRTARAKGLSERVVVTGHALRGSLIPLITVVGLQAGRLLGGAVIIEQVFAWPGMGRLMINAIEGRDYLVVQGGLLVLVGAFVLVNLLTDLLYGVVDPRVRIQ